MQESYIIKNKTDFGLVTMFLYNLYKDKIDNGLGNIIYKDGIVTITILER